QGCPELVELEVSSFLEAEDIELHFAVGDAVEQASVVLAGEHQQGKAGQLSGAVVDVQSVQVVFENQLGNIPAAVASFFVDGFEQLVGFHENMPGAAGWIEHFYGLRLDAGRGVGSHVGKHFCRLLAGPYVVGQSTLQGRIRVGL